MKRLAGACLVLHVCLMSCAQTSSGPIDVRLAEGEGATKAGTAGIHSYLAPQQALWSRWNGGPGDLFRDMRAARPGDLLTINISINDRASIGNATDRSSDSSARSSFQFVADLLGLSREGALSGSVESQSGSKGQGTINRSEKIQFSIAASVIALMPNGNLVIEGRQEIRINHEVRLLTISGIVRPRDISRDNTISYDKIADAKVTYGGHGRISDVQQPAWGHQIYDRLRPF